MKKGIYFSQINTNASYQGAVAKVFDQIKTFERAGFEMRHVNFSPVSSGLRKTHIGKGICAAIPFTYVFSKYKHDPSLDGYDFYYFRFEAADWPFTRFLKKLKQNNPDSKVIIEFPDYPNTMWLQNPIMLPILLKDMAARGQYRNNVDRFAIINPIYKEVYGVPVVTFMNGIDVSRIPVIHPINGETDRIEAIGIGTMIPVHGFERFIKSMADYYEHGGNRDILFHIVGNGPGPELKRYIAVTEETGMQDHVVFEGRLTGDELTVCYNKCTLAIEQLALYRKMGLKLSSSLKSREYLAKGLPIISGSDIDVLLGKDYKYWLQFENDDSLMDMNRIIEFYDRIYSEESRDEVISNIRRFAEENCTYDSTMKKIVDYINDVKGA